MFYLIGQIAVTILFTALIGMTIGWLLRGLGTSRQTDAIEARWRARVQQLQEHSGDTTAAAGQQTAADPAANRKIAELEIQIEQRDKALEALRTAKSVRAKRGSDTDALASQLQESTELCSQLQGHLAEQSTATDQLKAQLERSATEREMLIERLRDRETEIGRMSQERQHAINTIAGLQKEMRTLRGERSRAEQPPPAAKTPAQPPPAAMTPVQPPAQPPPAAKTPTQPPPAAPRNQAPPAPVVQPQLEPEPERQQSLPIANTAEPTPEKRRYEPEWRLAAPQGPKDNLQAIFGIGPKLEMQLNRLGIFHFEQIGRFQSDDILWVAHHLKSFPGRIVRDRWIEQAQTLSNQKRP